MAFQDQKLHEDSKSYQDLEDTQGEYFQIKSRLEDFVQSRRILNIPESQESENPRTNISSASSNVPAEEGNQSPKRGRGSADPTPLYVGSRFLFCHVFPRLYIATLGLGSRHPIHYQGVKTTRRRDNNQRRVEGRDSSPGLEVFQFPGVIRDPTQPSNYFALEV